MMRPRFLVEAFVITVCILVVAHFATTNPDPYPGKRLVRTPQGWALIDKDSTRSTDPRILLEK